MQPDWYYYARARGTGGGRRCMRWRGAVRWACVRGEAAHKIKYLRYGDRSRRISKGEEWVGYLME